MDERAESLAIRRLRVLARFCCFWAILIVGRLVMLQVFQRDEYHRIAQSQQDRQVELLAPRGAIQDRNGKLMAKSLPVESVSINPLRIADPALAAELLGRLLEMDSAQLLSKIIAAQDARRGFMWVKRKVPAEQAESVRNLNLDWVEFRTESKRFYPKGMLGANLIGSVDHQEKGNAGIEQGLDKDLTGKPGVMYTTSDVRKRVLDLKVFSDPVPGKTVTLTIDERIQFIAERELKAAIQRTHAKTGSVVVMDPKTGDVLAMASYPSFDPNKQPEPGESLAARRNLPVTAPFEPGSVFKVITLSGALESTNIRPDTVIDCGNGRLTLFKRVIHDHHSYSSLTMAEVLAKSSNIGSINIARKMGQEKLYEYVKRFGFGTKTGLPIPGEESGWVRPTSRWIPSSIGSIAMGHELTTTTVQLARAAAVVASGGFLVQPRLVLRTEREGEQPVPALEPELKRVIAPETAMTMRKMMEGVILFGTGKKARLSGYTAGGKTGTAQIYDAGLRAYTHKYNSSFMGFAPLNNPAIVIVASVNGTSTFGADAAGPIFKEVATAALRYLDIPKDAPEIVDPQPGDDEPSNDLAIADLGDPELPPEAQGTDDKPAQPPAMMPSTLEA
ncbi:MAG TPA: penicillin-binding protein 2, partial [Bryobacteraceae bacterium]|nr:penicillin-binding protein 2 [Bryobacteraceae bacterium]